MQEIVLTSELGSKLMVKAEIIGGHHVLQTNDFGYHLPCEALIDKITLLKHVSKTGSDVEM